MREVHQKINETKKNKTHKINDYVNGNKVGG